MLEIGCEWVVGVESGDGSESLGVPRKAEERFIQLSSCLTASVTSTLLRGTPR